MTLGVARTTLLVGLAVAAVSASGCSTKAPEQTSVMRQVGDLGFTARELRIHTFHYASFFASVVEIAADSIMRATDDPEIVMRALVWKTNAIPAIQVAVFNLDPFVGYLDAAILTRLQYEYFDSGFGAHRFGELQPIARQAATLLTARIDSTLADLKSRGLDLVHRRGLGGPLGGPSGQDGQLLHVEACAAAGGRDRGGWSRLVPDHTIRAEPRTGGNRG